jgi:hypothetical protein
VTPRTHTLPPRFSILVRGQTAAWLSAGVPSLGSAPAHTNAYFALRADNLHGNLSITALPLGGSVDLYISTAFFPNSSFYTWRSTGPQAIVHIRDTDAQLCAAPCTYFIAVGGWESNVTFTLVGATDGVPVGGTLLPDGVPTVNSLSALASQEYQVLLAPVPGSPMLQVRVQSGLCGPQWCGGMQRRGMHVYRCFRPPSPSPHADTCVCPNGGGVCVRHAKWSRPCGFH